MQNPLLDKATVVDRTAAAAALDEGSATAPPSSPPQPPTDATSASPLVDPKRKKKIPFEKGYSQMDWLRLTQSGTTDLTGLGKGGPVRHRKDISLEEVAQHRTVEDGWTVLRGRVYNLTPYLKFHPGGVAVLKSILGRDGTALFNRYHAWVNAEFLLAKCMIGTVDAKTTTSSSIAAATTTCSTS